MVTRTTREGIWDSEISSDRLEGWFYKKLYPEYVEYWNGLDRTEEGIRRREMERMRIPSPSPEPPSCPIG